MVKPQDSTESPSLFILAFGAHPDDTDIGCSGTLALHAEQGHLVGVCDLTHAELSSNGTVTTRDIESGLAAQALGLTVRETLDLRDRHLKVDDDTVQQIVDIIRKYRPVFVLAPDWEDRHPDHRQCAAIVEEAVFSAALRRYDTPDGHLPHRVKQVLHYAVNGMHEPDVAIDISGTIEKKQKAIQAYGSQFQPSQGHTATPLNQGFVDAIVGRDALVGHQTGCRYAEGFRVKKPVTLHSLSPLA